MRNETGTRQIAFERIGITNDFMFCTVLEDEGRCREFLERVLGIEIAEISLVQKQWTEQNHFAYKGIRLDVYVQDVEGNSYDIELQAATEAYLAKRCRYYHSEMDGYQIRQGVKYKHLKKSIVIFVCTYDPFGEDFSVYTFEKACLEKPEIKLEDEAQTIIINTAGSRDGLSEALTNLLDYFKTGNITDTYTEELQRQVDALKHDEDWRDRYMTLEMKMDEKYEAGIEAGKELGIELGKELGKELGILQILVPQVCHMLSQEQGIDIIAKALYVSEERIQQIYEAAKKYAPDYDAQKVLNELVLDQVGR